MKIEVLKSKITGRVLNSSLNNMGVINLSYELMDEANLIDHERVVVINESTGQQHFLFVEGIDEEYDAITLPDIIGCTGQKVTINSIGSVTVDGFTVNPIIINLI
jgi:predicted double-glycine peptidase